MKEYLNIYNPFNSNKLIYHANYWKKIADGYIPPPILVTLDPINRCNFKCQYCNASYKMKCSSEKYSDYVISNVSLFLKNWGVKAVCCAGGGEPLLHNKIDNLIDNLYNDEIQIGLVTNGSLINKHLKTLSLCKWVGISVDAGDSEDFSKLKNIKKDIFIKVINNMETLCKTNTEVTYKFLAHPLNIKNIYEAVKIAKNIGCNFFHLRPCGKTWDNLNEPNIFNEEDILMAKDQLEKAREDFEDDFFKVIGIIHKFSKNWEIKHNFKKCYALGMTAIIEPGNYISLCCDRRGDARTLLGKFEKIEEILYLWNSKKHWEIINSIDLKDCPRCTYSPHNEIFENIILCDKMCKNFI